jgi:hypothetical protein
MRIGFRIPSLAKRIAARTSVKRFIRHNLGVKAPRGLGWITNPKKALYNRIYSRTTIQCLHEDKRKSASEMIEFEKKWHVMEGELGID